MPKIENVRVYGLDEAIKTAKYPKAVNIDKLNDELTNGIKACFACKTGEGHDCALKGIVVQCDLTLSQNAWQQWERYHFADIVASQSKMHKIIKFDIKSQCNRYVDPRIVDIVNEKVAEYNRLLDAEKPSAERKALLDGLYLSILYNIPCGFELTAGIVTNYLQLKTMYQQRRHHRLPDWQVLCDWMETLPRFMELTQSNADNG